MSGQSEKKRKKAAEAALKSYLLWVMVINGFYFLGRLLPPYLGFLGGAAGRLGFGGLLRFAVAAFATRSIAALLADAAGENAAAGKNADGKAGEHYFDAFAV